MKPKILIFASGTKASGGSGFANLVRASRTSLLKADVAGVVSNYEHGGVHKLAQDLSVPFFFMQDFSADSYQRLAIESQADLFILSGWLKQVKGLDPVTGFNSQTVLNIHPGPLPKFGGPGMYGKHVHAAVLDAYLRGELTNTVVTIHFITDEFDEGPAVITGRVPILQGDTVANLEARVKECEHDLYPRAINMVLGDNWQ